MKLSPTCVVETSAHLLFLSAFLMSDYSIQKRRASENFPFSTGSQLYQSDPVLKYKKIEHLAFGQNALH